MKRVMRCHDFRSDQGVRRRQYREYCLGARRGDGRKVVPARRVAARTAANFVACLGCMSDISCAPLRVIDRSGSNAHVFHYVRGSKLRSASKRSQWFGSSTRFVPPGRFPMRSCARRVRRAASAWSNTRGRSWCSRDVSHVTATRRAWHPEYGRSSGPGTRRTRQRGIGPAICAGSSRFACHSRAARTLARR